MRLVKRSWGWYFVLFSHTRFKVKLLRFKKVKSQNMQLSMQRHMCRNELWLFLKGSGWLHADPLSTDFMKNYQIVNAGDYIDIQSGFWHTFFPFCTTWVLEVQYGDKCEEADIVRL